MVVFIINDVFTNLLSFKLEDMKFIRSILKELSGNTGICLDLCCVRTVRNAVPVCGFQ